MNDTKLLTVNMILEVDANAVDKVKVITHHADRLLDLDSWPEIKSVSRVTVKEGTWLPAIRVD